MYQSRRRHAKKKQAPLKIDMGKQFGMACHVTTSQTIWIRNVDDQMPIQDVL